MITTVFVITALVVVAFLQATALAQIPDNDSPNVTFVVDAGKRLYVHVVVANAVGPINVTNARDYSTNASCDSPCGKCNPQCMDKYDEKHRSRSQRIDLCQNSKCVILGQHTRQMAFVYGSLCCLRTTVHEERNGTRLTGIGYYLLDKNDGVQCGVPRMLIPGSPSTKTIQRPPGLPWTIAYQLHADVNFSISFVYHEGVPLPRQSAPESCFYSTRQPDPDNFCRVDITVQCPYGSIANFGRYTVKTSARRSGATAFPTVLVEPAGKPECLKPNCSTYGRCATSPSGPSCKCFSQHVGYGCRYSCNPEDWRADAFGAEIDANCDYTTKTLFCNSPQASSTYFTANGNEVAWGTKSYPIAQHNAKQGKTLYQCWYGDKKELGLNFTLIVRGEVRVDPVALENLKHVVNTSVVEAPILPCVPEPICTWEPVGDPNRAGCILNARSCVLNITEAGVGCAGTYRLVVKNKYNMNPLIIDVNYLARSPTANKDHSSYFVYSIFAFAVVAVISLVGYLFRSRRGGAQARGAGDGPLYVPAGDEEEADRDADPHHPHANGGPGHEDEEHGGDRLSFPVQVVHDHPGAAVVGASSPSNVPAPLPSQGSPHNVVVLELPCTPTPVECSET